MTMAMVRTADFTVVAALEVGDIFSMAEDGKNRAVVLYMADANHRDKSRIVYDIIFIDGEDKGRNQTVCLKIDGNVWIYRER